MPPDRDLGDGNGRDGSDFKASFPSGQDSESRTKHHEKARWKAPPPNQKHVEHGSVGGLHTFRVSEAEVWFPKLAPGARGGYGILSMPSMNRL